MKYSIDQKIGCVSREIRMRERVYSHQVLDGRMTQEKADSEIGIMAEILTELKAQKDASEGPGLF